MMPVPESIRDAINEKTKAIVVINPNNPTGATYPRELLQEIANIAAEAGILLIADEIYDKMTLDTGEAVNMRSLTGGQPLVSGNGMSKNFLYPGARVGYLALHGDGMDGLRAALVKLCNQRLSVNWEMQRGAIAAFTQPLNHIEKVKAALRERRDAIFEGMNSIPGVYCPRPTAAFYAFPKITSDAIIAKFGNSTAFVYALLEQTGVLFVPGSAFGSEGFDFRTTFLPSPAELNEVIGKTKAFMEQNA